MVTTMPTNMADVAKRPGGTRQAAADRDMRQAKRQTVTLTPAEVKCTDSQDWWDSAAQTLHRPSLQKKQSPSPRSALRKRRRNPTGNDSLTLRCHSVAP